MCDFSWCLSNPTGSTCACSFSPGERVTVKPVGGGWWGVSHQMMGPTLSSFAWGCANVSWSMCPSCCFHNVLTLFFLGFSPSSPWPTVYLILNYFNVTVLVYMENCVQQSLAVSIFRVSFVFRTQASGEILEQHSSTVTDCYTCTGGLYLILKKY